MRGPGTPPITDPIDVTIEGITIAGHIYTEENPYGPIQNHEGKLTLRDCRVVDNEGVMVSAIYNSPFSELYLENTLIARNNTLSTDNLLPYKDYINDNCYAGAIYMDTGSNLYMERSTIADNINYSTPITIETGYGQSGYGQTGYGKSVTVRYGAIQCLYNNYLDILDSIMWYNGRTTDQVPDISNVYSTNQTRDIANLVTRQQTIPGTGTLDNIIDQNPEFINRRDCNYNPSNENCIGLGSYLEEGIPPTEPQPPPPPPMP
jgi:hypothetical protein